MLKRFFLPLIALSALVLIGCSHMETNSSNHNTASNANRSATTTSSPTTSPVAATTSAKTGVPECDDYITKFDACINGHIPEAARAQYKASLETQRTQWQKLAANPQTKASLAQACKTAQEQQRTALKAFKCTF